MKVHPALKKRSIISRYLESTVKQRKLRRLPHIFNRVLVLPIDSETNVSIQENPDNFRFIVTTEEIEEDVRAHILEIFPGIVKIVIGGKDLIEFPVDDLEMSLWRIRLPDSTRPEMATAIYVEGELTVTVPKECDLCSC